MNADFEVYVDDEFMAGTSGPREEALREALHYAMQYTPQFGGNGVVTLFEVTRTKVALHELATGTLAATECGTNDITSLFNACMFKDRCVAAERELEELRGKLEGAEKELAVLRWDAQKVRLEWSDRSAYYHPTEFYLAVVHCSLDHHYDRSGDGVPYEIPEKLRSAFSPVVERHLSAVEPDWENKSVYMSDEQRDNFTAELKATQDAALTPPEKHKPAMSDEELEQWTPSS